MSVRCPSRIPLPAPLCSTPVTALPRSYGRSDSCAGGSSAPASMNTVLDSRAGLPASCAMPSCPFRLHPPHVPRHRFCTLPLSGRRFPATRGLRFRLLRAGSSLTSGRIEFVILRTGHSPSIAPHLASRRRSYRWVRAGERMPGEDLHLSVMAPLQAHSHRASRGSDAQGTPDASGFGIQGACVRGSLCIRNAGRRPACDPLMDAVSLASLLLRALRELRGASC